MKRLYMVLLTVPLLAGCQVQVTGGKPVPSPTPSSGPSATARPSPSASSGHSGHQVSDEQSLIDHLRSQGARIERGEDVQQPFLKEEGRLYTVNGQSIQVYEYDSAAALEADASQISPDGGSTKTTMISWLDDPHFFKQGRVLVLYIGKNQSLLDLLKGALGAQFAGR